MERRWIAVRAGLIVGALIAVVAPARAAESDASMRPFDARYRVWYYGVRGGTIEMSLRRGASAEEYVYTAKTNPNALGRIVVGADAYRSSVMRINQGMVQPQRYVADDDRDPSRRSDVQFDWANGRVIGAFEGVQLDMLLPAGSQDYLSSDIAVMMALLNGADLPPTAILDEADMRLFKYVKEGTAHRKFNNKRLEVIVLRSEPPDGASGRISRYWRASDLGFIPVAMERSRKGKTDITMQLLEFTYVD